MTASDDDIWQRYTSTVKPLKTSGQNQHIFKPLVQATNRSHDLNLPPPFARPLKFCTFESDAGSVPPFVIEMWSKKLQKSSIDATLDLHGQIMKNAYRILVRFVETAVQRNHRLLLIITGKSLKKRSTDAPRLVEHVPLWLNSSPLNQYIKKITYARWEHGGHGAYYVFLRFLKDIS